MEDIVERYPGAKRDFERMIKFPPVKIGRYLLSEMGGAGEGQIWIQDGDEDGGSFPTHLLEAHIKEFYNKHL